MSFNRRTDRDKSKPSASVSEMGVLSLCDVMPLKVFQDVHGYRA